METIKLSPEIEKLLSDTKVLEKKEEIRWEEIVGIERSALNLWVNKPELRDMIHHKFTDALSSLQEISPHHNGAVRAVLMLHRIAMHPNTGYGLIDEFIEDSRTFGLSGDLTRQDIESLMQIGQGK